MIISVDGATGVGKTTLARFIGQRYGFALVLEENEQVSIPREFLREPKRYALEAELALVRLHSTQLASIASSPAVSVTDLSLQRDLAYARITLAAYPDASATFLREWKRLRQSAPRIDLLVLLICPTDVLRQRIRNFDRQIDSENFLPRLSAGITSAYREYPNGATLVVDSSCPVEEYPIYEPINRMVIASR